jgi:hypothetical protein
LVSDPHDGAGRQHSSLQALGPLKLRRVDLSLWQIAVSNISAGANGKITVRPIEGATSSSPPFVGSLSPCEAVTLDAEHRHFADIPDGAHFFSFVYPCIPPPDGAPPASTRDSDRRDRSNSSFEFFLSLGGYIYLDQTKQGVVAVRSLAHGPGLNFARVVLSKDAPTSAGLIRAALWDSGRMVEPTMYDVLACGVERFCWLAPKEVLPGLNASVASDLWPHGAFVYLYDEAEARFDCIFSVTKARRASDAAATVPTGVSDGVRGVHLPHATGSAAVQYDLEATPPCLAVVRRLSRETGGSKKYTTETLMNISVAPRSSHMGRLADVLSRMDHLSHCLVWTRGDARPGEAVAASLVEMPRLQLRFRAEGGRLWSLDHDGCFISDRAVTQNAALREQLRILDTSLVLENEQREIFLLVPNYGIRRPVVKACPMSTVLVSDRTAQGWRHHVKAVRTMGIECASDRATLGASCSAADA